MKVLLAIILTALVVLVVGVSALFVIIGLASLKDEMKKYFMNERHKGSS